MRTGTANLPLHGGAAPRWLFARMARLAREITRCIVEERGPRAMLRRLADPWWFQAFGCVLGFDWHSSGLTTTTCGALKQGLRGAEADLGLFVAGGKDGYPYPVDRDAYDRSIEVLREAVNRARVGDREKLEAVRRLVSC